MNHGTDSEPHPVNCKSSKVFPYSLPRCRAQSWWRYTGSQPAGDMEWITP